MGKGLRNAPGEPLLSGRGSGEEGIERPGDLGGQVESVGP